MLYNHNYDLVPEDINQKDTLYQLSSNSPFCPAPSLWQTLMAPLLQYSCLENPMAEEPGGLQSMGSLRVGHDRVTSLSLFTFMHWRRKWQPTAASCLENPRDGVAWWAAVYGITQSRTRLK